MTELEALKAELARRKNAEEIEQLKAELARRRIATHLQSVYPDDWEKRAKTLEETVFNNEWIPAKYRTGLTLKQAEFLVYDGRECLYGGSAGGGKSIAALMGAAQYVNNPNYHALILRRTYKQLAKAESILNVSKEWWHGKAKWNGDTYTWTFPSGATVEFGHMDGPNDHLNYQGAVFQFVCYDELTQWGDEQQYTFLFTRQRRPLGSELPIRMRATSNPGGPGHEWVKKRFIDPKTRRDEAHFIPAKLDDNPNLDRAEYIASMGQVDPITRDQMLGGNWDAIKGGRFLKEWFRYYRKDDEGYVNLYSKSGEVIERFLPHLRPRWQTYDPSAGATDDSDPFVISTWCLSPQSNLVWLECHRERLEIPDQIAVAQRLYRRWQPQFMTVEEVLNQKAHAQILRRSLDPVMVVKSVSPKSKNKLERATPALVFVASGRLFLPEDNRAFPLDDVEGELIRFTGEDGNPDDACLTADAMITTASGQKRIVDVPVGEHVWTRAGWKPVLASGMTSPNAEVLTVELDNGVRLTGTCAHRVASSIKEWRRMDELQPGDEVLVWPTNQPLPTWNSVTSTDGNTADTRTASGATTACTSSATTTGRRPRDCSTGTSGSSTTGRSPKGTTSTTATGINSTTTSATSSASPSLNTGVWMPNSEPTEATRFSPTSNASATSVPSGTGARRGESGTVKTPRSHGRSENQTTSCASSVGQHSKPLSERERPSFVSPPVPLKTDECQASTTRPGPVASAESLTASVDSQKPELVAASVVACWPGNDAAVYNLTVEGCPEYLANGVLTHNCDTLFYSVESLSWVAPYAGMSGKDLKPGVLDPTRPPDAARTRAAAMFDRPAYNTFGNSPGVVNPSGW